MNGPKQLTQAGQSIWLDNIRKGLLTEGTLERYIREYYVTGVTSNPTILEKAISGGEEYDQAIRDKAAKGIVDPEELAFALALEDLGAAADLMKPVFDRTSGADGFVSVEVSPTLAFDAPGTVAAGEALFAQAGRPNVMIKVPGTPAGLVAVEELIGKGIPVNVTLLFSPGHYLGAAEAYLRGLERRMAAGQPLPVGSVASVFVSRWDAAADPGSPRSTAASSPSTSCRRRTRCTATCWPPTAGRRSPMGARCHNGCCGRARPPRTRTCPTRITLAVWPRRARLTRCRSPR